MQDPQEYQLSRYHLLQLIGQGAFSYVYLAEHVYLKMRVALKIMRVRLPDQDRANFLKEAEIAGQLVHPNIVPTYDCGVEGEVLYLAMAYAANGSMRKRYPQGSRLAPSEVVRYVRQAAAALQYAHNLNIIHRDIKPENMLLGPQGELWLSDFGLSLELPPSHSLSLQELAGTLYYMAPEQARGKPRLASDQYSLAAVAYEWLCGHRPFEGSYAELLTQLMSAPVAPLRACNPAVPPALEEVVLKALAKDPHERFASVQAFSQALEDVSNELPTVLSLHPQPDESPKATPPGCLQQVATLPPVQVPPASPVHSAQAATPSWPLTPERDRSPESLQKPHRLSSLWSQLQKLFKPSHSISENVPMTIPGTSLSSPEQATPLPSEVAMAPSSNITDLRYSDVSFPDQTVVGRTEGLRVAITCESLNVHAVPLPLERPPNTNQLIQVDVYVIVCPSDFDVEGSNIRTLLVPPHADSAPAFFKLTAKSEGKKKIAVEFFQNTRYLGRAQIETIVEAARQPLPQSLSRPKSVQMTLQMSTISPPDLTILFDRVSTSQDKHYYRYRLLSPIRELNLWFDEFHSPETNITPQGFLEETFSHINRMIGNANLSEYLFFEQLKSIGMHLYNRLIPDDLKRLYWNELRNKIKTLVIISYEPWIPWEILRPVNPDTKQVEDCFLCEKFDLTRWLAGSGFPDTLSLEQLGLIMSMSDLDSAKQESAEIKRLLGTKVKEIVSSGEAIYQLLCTTDCSGLHFACHGSFNKENADLSTIALEDGAVLSPIDIEGDRLAFGHCKPLVFLNACDTGQSGYGLTGMGGWAEAFIGRAKCSGFIGSIWKANDDAACKFAIAFYSKLLEGRSVAEAARLARQVIKQAGDPTWLSYTVYANPLARIEL